MTDPRKQPLATAGLVARIATAIGSCLFATIPLPASANEEGGSICSAAEYRSMDFRIGHFDGVTAGGLPAGVSDVEAILSGCALVERWQGAISGKGMAFFYRTKGDGLWLMRYANDDGETLELSGTADAEGVTFTGPSSFYSYVGLHRMRWQREPGGAVRQIWQLSEDNGASWASVVEMVLTPSAKEAP